MKNRLRIGLTGGIASGKTTVARRFMELGIPVIDADDSARRVVVPGSQGLAAIVETFGPQVLTADGGLDRPAMRDRVFQNAAARRDLEVILHPLIRADMESRASMATGPYLVMAIPLLLEGDRQGRMDRVLVVDATEDHQIERVLARDGGTLEQARAILAAQSSREKRLQSADDIIRNMGTVAELTRSVDDLNREYLRLASTWQG